MSNLIFFARLALTHVSTTPFRGEVSQFLLREKRLFLSFAFPFRTRLFGLLQFAPIALHSGQIVLHQLECGSQQFASTSSRKHKSARLQPFLSKLEKNETVYCRQRRQNQHHRNSHLHQLQLACTLPKQACPLSVLILLPCLPKWMCRSSCYLSMILPLIVFVATIPNSNQIVISKCLFDIFTAFWSALINTNSQFTQTFSN